MLRFSTALAVTALILAAGLGAPASGAATSSATSAGTQELAAQTTRPRVTIYPRRFYPGPNAKRQCHSWLVTQYRVSGPVIVPQMRCWWE